MTSTPRFVALWMAASVPLPWLGVLFLETYLRGVFENVRVAYVTLIIPYTAAIAAVVATFQSRVMARHRHPVPAWTRAVLVGHILSSLVFASIDIQWTDFRGSFGAVRLPSWWFWIVSVLVTLSCSFCIAAAEAWALRKVSPRLSWPVWIVARVGLMLGLVGAMLTFKLYPLGLVAGFIFFESWSMILAISVWHLALSAASAWMLDRLVFGQR